MPRSMLMTPTAWGSRSGDLREANTEAQEVHSGMNMTGKACLHEVESSFLTSPRILTDAAADAYDETDAADAGDD